MELVIVTEVAVQLTVVTSQNAKMTEHIMKDPFNSTFAHALKRDKEENFIAIQNPKFYAKAMKGLESNRENDQLEKRELDVALSGLLTLYSDHDPDVDSNFQWQCVNKGEKGANQTLTPKNENYQTELEQDIILGDIENENVGKIIHARNEFEKAPCLRNENLNDSDSQESKESHIQSNVTNNEINEKSIKMAPVLLESEKNISDLCVKPKSLLIQQSTEKECFQGLSEDKNSTKDPNDTNDNKSTVNSNEQREFPPATMERGSPPVIVEKGSPPVNVEKGSPPVIGEKGSPPVIGEKGSPPVIVERGSPPVIGEKGSPPVIRERGSAPVIVERGSPPVIGEKGSPPVIVKRGSPPVIVARGNTVSLKQIYIDHQYTTGNISSCDPETKNLGKGVKKDDILEMFGKTKNNPKWPPVFQIRFTKQKEGSNLNEIQGRSSTNLSKKKEDILSKNFISDVTSQNHKNSKIEISGQFHDKIARSSKLSENEFYCDVCDLKLTSSTSLLSHQTKTKHKENERLAKRFRCDICGKDYVSKKVMVRHRKIHTDKEKPYPCEICGKKFQTKCTMKSHTLIHTDKFDFLCDICPKKFRHRCDLTKHQKTHSGIKEHWCKVCNKGFLKKANMERHMLLHTGIKSFICEYCGKAFRSKTNLTEHAQLHTGYRQFKCEVCGKGFNQKKQLWKHAKIHTGEKQFICETCGFKTCDKSSLICHHRQHTGESPYICHICEKKFNKSSDMKRHIKRHKKGLGKPGRKVSTEVKVFLCSICNSSFSKNWKLTRHVKSVHAKMT